MKARTLSIPKTERDINEASNASHRMLSVLSGKPPMMIIDIPDKRQHTKRVDTDHSEASVMRDVIALLSNHPRVLFAVRQSSGMAYNENKAPIYFYRWARSRVKMRIVDFWGMLTDGVMFALEAKNRNWKKPSGEREMEQKAFLDTVSSHGGVSGFVTSAEQARVIIEQQPNNQSNNQQGIVI